MQNQVVFITGASSGIGAALAKVYARQGHKLVLCARRLDRLEEVKSQCFDINSNSQVEIIKCDVTKEEDLRNAVNRSLDRFGRIDVVYANAGNGVGGKVEKLSLSDFRRQFETNVFSVLSTVYATLNELKKTQGSLVLIGSVYSYLSDPGKAPYCMSKFAIRALADSLYLELKPHGVSVTLICPGLVESEIRKVDNQGKFQPEMKDRAPQWLVLDAGTAAKQIKNAVELRKKEAVITNHAKVAVWIKRFFPSVVNVLTTRLAPPRQ